MKLFALLIVFFISQTVQKDAEREPSKSQVFKDAEMLSNQLLDTIIEGLMNKRLFRDLHTLETRTKKERLSAYEKIKSHSTVSVMGVKNEGKVSYYDAASIGLPDGNISTNKILDLLHNQKLDMPIRAITARGLAQITKAIKDNPHIKSNPAFQNIHVVETKGSVIQKVGDKKKQPHAEMKLLAFNSKVIRGDIMAIGTSKPACVRCHEQLVKSQGQEGYLFTKTNTNRRSNSPGYVEPSHISGNQFIVYNVDVSKSIAVTEVKITPVEENKNCNKRNRQKKAKGNQHKATQKFQSNPICVKPLPGSKSKRFINVKLRTLKNQQYYSKIV